MWPASQRVVDLVHVGRFDQPLPMVWGDVAQPGNHPIAFSVTRAETAQRGGERGEGQRFDHSQLLPVSRLLVHRLAIVINSSWQAVTRVSMPYLERTVYMYRSHHCNIDFMIQAMKFRLTAIRTV